LAHARSTGFRNRSSSRRRTAWEIGPRTTAVQSLVAAGASVAVTGAQALTDGLTIVRIRGELVLNLSAATSAGDGFVDAAAGLCIINENASGIGITAIPTPLTDLAWDGWMWHQAFGEITSQETTPLNRDFYSLRIPVDTKAMRKFDESDVLVMVVELGTEVGGAQIDFTCLTRLLVKLP